MARNRNTTTTGGGFDSATIAKIWAKGRVIQSYDPNVWRHDMYGKVMKYADYGKTSSEHGWEIDHIKPVAKGGTDDLGNLQPLQWETNRDKSDTYPWYCGM
jgi:hypothetical protein